MSRANTARAIVLDLELNHLHMLRQADAPEIREALAERIKDVGGKLKAAQAKQPKKGAAK